MTRGCQLRRELIAFLHYKQHGLEWPLFEFYAPEAHVPDTTTCRSIRHLEG